MNTRAAIMRRLQCAFVPRIRLKRFIVVGVCLLTGIAAVFLLHLRGSQMCSRQESLQVLSDLCKAFQHGRIVGKLCADICSSNRMKYLRCLNYRGGKVILLMSLNGMPVILKTQEIKVSAWKSLAFVFGGNGYPKVKTFVEMVLLQLSPLLSNSYQRYAEEAHIIKQNVLENPDKTLSHKQFQKNFTTENILSEILSMPIHVEDTSQPPEISKKGAVMDSIWSVVQQHEFVFMKINRNWRFIPQIYGTCGKFYGMEYVLSGPLLEADLFQSGLSELKRVEISLQFLDLVCQMDEWSPEPLHMCDVKLENFGWNSKQLKTVDVDMFFFNGQMDKEIMAAMNCSMHSDCDFFDCRGWCDHATGRCLPQRTNNNLQSVCSKIFMDTLANGYKGLFHSLPHQIKHRMERLLQECAHPVNSPDISVPGKAPLEVGEKIRLLLEEVRKMLS